ncbi:MAG: peroxiredoxin family protein [bacterium]
MSHDLGFCACETLRANADGVAACTSGKACTLEDVAATYGTFTENERKVIEYIGDNVVATGKTSLDTLPILTDLTKKYEAQGLVILPVYVNSGSVEDILTWSAEMNLGYPLLVSKDKNISEAYNSRMVPSIFLIDRDGRIVKKYVGYKDKEVLDQAFGELLKAFPGA